MRLTVNLEEDVYAIARALARTENCSISEAVNRLVRRGLVSRTRLDKTSGFPVVRGAKPFSSEDVYRIEGDDS